MRNLKRCSGCDVVKSHDQFYRATHRADGLQTRCKDCHIAANRVSRLKHPEARREALRSRDQAAETARKAEWRANNLEKNRAKNAVYRATKSGDLTRPDTCERCGASAQQFHIQAHHEDYRRQLDVVWLCSPCHGQRHLELKGLAA